LSKRHHSDYDEVTTARCERALVTLLGEPVVRAAIVGQADRDS